MNKQSSKKDLEVGIAREELAAFLSAHPEIEFIDAAIADIAGTLRGKRIAVEDALKLCESGMQLPASLHLMDVRGEMMNPQGRGYSDGDPDGTAWPIAGTVVRVWGAEPPRGQVLMDFRDAKGAPLPHDPRAMLQHVLTRLAELDLTPVAAHELEFYLIDPQRDLRGRPLPPVNSRNGQRENAPCVYGLDDLDRYQGFLTALHAAAEMQRVPFSAASKEYAPGQFEANLRHRADALQASDDAIFLRQIVKVAALKNGFQASFMSKPYPDKSGSGQHVHVSLIDRQGRNIFDNGTQEGSEYLRFAAGGLATLMPESMALFAPNLNDYRRFAPDMFAPVNRRWGVNNRSAGLRVPAGSSSARRIEHRCAGADANPYLVMAAILAGIHYGITQRIDPGAPAVGNVSHEPDTALPFCLEDALRLLQTGEHIPHYLGVEGVALYRETKAAELQRFKKIISAEEYEWYL